MHVPVAPHTLPLCCLSTCAVLGGGGQAAEEREAALQPAEAELEALRVRGQAERLQLAEEERAGQGGGGGGLHFVER